MLGYIEYRHPTLYGYLSLAPMACAEATYCEIGRLCVLGTKLGHALVPEQSLVTPLCENV
jgi:hypothetical protein